MIVQQNEKGETCICETGMFGMFVFTCKRLNWSAEKIKKEAKIVLDIYKDSDIEKLEENEKNLIENLNKIVKEGFENGRSNN
jgi:hypothetical protein